MPIKLNAVCVEIKFHLHHIIELYLYCFLLLFSGIKAARAIGLASCCATELEYGTKITDIFSILSDAMRENFRCVQDRFCNYCFVYTITAYFTNNRNQRVKLALLPALGQLLYLVAEQEEGNLCNTAEEDKKGNWGVPSSAYLILNRCLREGVGFCAFDSCCHASRVKQLENF